MPARLERDRSDTKRGGKKKEKNDPNISADKYFTLFLNSWVGSAEHPRALSCARLPSPGVGSPDAGASTRDWVGFAILTPEIITSRGRRTDAFISSFYGEQRGFQEVGVEFKRAGGDQRGLHFSPFIAVAAFLLQRHFPPSPARFL